MDTPVPIPNTEVKHFNANDSVSENRKLQILFFYIFYSIYIEFFLLYNSYYFLGGLDLCIK